MAMLQSRTLRARWAQWIGLGCIVFLVGCNSRMAGVSRAQTAGEDSIRRLDEAWVKAAESRKVDDWMSFYADDAVVLPPNDKVATSKDAIRKSVAELLGLPGLSLTWQPTKVEVAKSGELAYLYGAYELTMNDPHGKPVKDYGKNVEIWKKQANGGWKCIVDTWNSDLPEAPATPDQNGA